jgi:membrane protein implicated in regulation of membrane protease activity
MTTQKKYLAFVILSVFILTVSVAVDSHAKNEKQSKKNLPMTTVSGTIIDIVTDDVEFDYLLIEDGDVEQWVAAPKNDFHKGDAVTCAEGVVLKNHRIKALKRNFKNIIFTECSK